MAGRRAARDFHRHVVEVEPALVEAQHRRKPLRREPLGCIEGRGVDAHGQWGRAQRRGGEFRLRPKRAGLRRLRGPQREREDARERQAIEGQLASDDGRSGLVRRRGRPADRLFGERDIRTGDRRGGRLRRRLVGEASIRFDPCDGRGKARNGPSLAAQGHVRAGVDRPDCAAGRSEAERRGEQGDVRALELGRAEEARLVALGRRRKASARRDVGAGEGAGRLDVVTCAPCARGMQPDVSLSARSRGPCEAELAQKRASVRRVEVEGDDLTLSLRPGVEREDRVSLTDRPVRPQRIERRFAGGRGTASRLECKGSRRQQRGALDERLAPLARREARDEESEIIAAGRR